MRISYKAIEQNLLLKLERGSPNAKKNAFGDPRGICRNILFFFGLCLYYDSGNLVSYFTELYLLRKSECVA